MTTLSRCITVGIAMILLVPGSVLGQVGSAQPTADLLLRVEESEIWEYVKTPDGTPVFDELVQMQDGEPMLDMSPSTRENYELHGVQDIYIYRASFIPTSNQYSSESTSVQTRAIRFDTSQDAEGYLTSIYDAQLEAVAAGEIPDGQFAPIEPLPEFDHPIVGWTMLVAYGDQVTNEVLGHASSVRYHAQIDNYLVSVQVSGPFVDYNFDAAYWLLGDAARCMRVDTGCPPTSLSFGSSDYIYIGGEIFFLNSPEDSGGTRWLYPVDSPVRAPLYAVSFGDSAFDVEEQSEESAPETDTEQADSPVSETASTATVIAASGNVRGQPTVNGAVVAVVTSGETVTITGESVMADGYEWVPITTANGVDGWIASTLIQRNE